MCCFSNGYLTYRSGFYFLSQWNVCDWDLHSKMFQPLPDRIYNFMSYLSSQVNLEDKFHFQNDLKHLTVSI